MLRAPPARTSLSARSVSAGPDGHGSATVGGVESVTSVLRVVGGAASTRFAAPARPTGSIGLPSADASTTSAAASALGQHGFDAGVLVLPVHRGADGVGRDRSAGHLHDQPDLAVGGTGGDGDERWLRCRAGRGEQGRQDEQDDEQEGPTRPPGRRRR